MALRGGQKKLHICRKRKSVVVGSLMKKGYRFMPHLTRYYFKKNHERGFEKDESERCRSFNHSGSSLPRSTRQSEPYILAEPICPRLLDNAEPTSFPGGLITIAFTSVKSPQTISLLFSSSSDLNYDSSFVKEFLH